MKIVTLEHWDVVLQDTINCLGQGGVVVMPTDTVYGIATNAYDEQAVQRIFAIKHRDTGKPLPVFVRDITMAHEVAVIDEKTDSFLEKVWPGAVTVIVSKKDKLSGMVTAHTQNVGLRIPRHTFVLELLTLLPYPLVVTSANISGESEILEASELIKTFADKPDQPDLILDAGNLPKSRPSTIIDFTQQNPKILREGAFDSKELLCLYNY